MICKVNDVSLCKQKRGFRLLVNEKDHFKEGLKCVMIKIQEITLYIKLGSKTPA